LVINLVYQIFKPERAKNHHEQDGYFQYRKRNDVQNNQNQQYNNTKKQSWKKSSFGHRKIPKNKARHGGKTTDQSSSMLRRLK